MKTRRNRTNNGYISHWFTAEEMGVVTPAIHYQNHIKENGYDYPSIPRPYSRPTDWLAMPDMTGTDQRVAMLLHLVQGASGSNGATADSNFIAFAISGAYIVDWGDGTTQAFAAGATAQYAYNFLGVSGGTATQTSRGARQVIVQAYPQAGSDFSRLDLNRVYSGNGVTGLSGRGGHHVPLVHLKMCGATFSSIDFASGPANLFHGSAIPQVRLNNLSLFEFVGPSSITNGGISGSSFFGRANCIEGVFGSEWTSKIVSFDSFFQNQQVLESAPFLNTITGQSFNNMFIGCLNLRFVPEYDTRMASTMVGMFMGTSSLNGDGIPTLNAPNLSNGTDMFRGLSSLTRFVRPMFRNFGANRARGTVTMDRLFFDSRYLRSVRTAFIGVDCSKIGSYGLAHSNNLGQSPLASAPNIFLGSVTAGANTAIGGMSGTFNGCSSLKWVPPYNFGSCGNMHSTFKNCTSLKHVPDFRLRSFGVTAGGSRAMLTNTFQSCSSLISWGYGSTMRAIDFTSFTNTFNGCASMYEGPSFDAPWTAETTFMFYNCNTMEVGPRIDLSRCTTGTAMFAECNCLRKIPDYNTQSLRLANSFFSNCVALTTPISLSAGVGLSAEIRGMFSNCISLTAAPSHLNVALQNARNVGNMFSGTSITVFPNITGGIPDTSKCTTMDLFYVAEPLQKLPYLDVGGVTHNSNAIFNSTSGPRTLCRGGLSGTRTSIGYGQSNLSPSALNEIFEGLSAGRGGLTPGTIRTITISSCWGASACDRSIATNKGWTIVG